MEILETNCTDNEPNAFALRSPKGIHLRPGEHGEILGRVEVGWEKMAFWSTKAAISLKRGHTEEKLLWGAYRNSPTLFRMVPSATPYGLPFLKIGGSHPTPKLQSLLSRECVKLRTSNFPRTITVSIRIIAHEKFWTKRSVGISRDCPNFLGTP